MVLPNGKFLHNYWIVEFSPAEEGASLMDMVADLLPGVKQFMQPAKLPENVFWD